MRLIPINCAREGQYLGKTIYDNNGRALLRGGVRLSSVYIKRIKELGIFTIYIDDEYVKNEIKDVIEPYFRQTAVQTVKHTFQSFDKINNNMGKNLSKAQEKDMLKQRDNYLKSIGQLAHDIIDQVLHQRDVMIELVDIKSLDNYTYQHSVNVAVLSLVLGLSLNLHRTELHSLCIGALLHDIGKIFVPSEIVQKPDNLTDQEFLLIKEHTTKGYEYLGCNSIDIPATARIIALQHHEKANGKGYPENRNINNINKLSKIVALADVYDALTSDRPYRAAMCPNEALEYIMANGGIQFDYEMVKKFARIIVPYPTGTLVKLSTGDIAVVEEANVNFPLRPKVRIVKSADNENIELDLEKNLHIVITGIQYEEPN